MKRSIRELKSEAKRTLSGHWGALILGLLAVNGLNGLASMAATYLFKGTDTLSLVLSQVFLLVASLITGIFAAGYNYMQLNIARGREYSLNDLLYFFKKHPDRVIIVGAVLAVIETAVTIPYYYVSFATDMGTTLEEQTVWMSRTLGLLLLSAVLNLILSLPFLVSHFLLADDEELSGREALAASIRMMKGNMGRYLLLHLSFLPLFLMSAFTLYIALLWVLPYMEMTTVAFYRDLRGELDMHEGEYREWI